MSRNGSGTYSLPSGNPVVTGTTISSTWANNTLNDIANALTDSIAADGQTTMAGNLQMGNNKIVNLNDGTDAGDAVNFGQLTAALTGGKVVQIVQSLFTGSSSSSSTIFASTGHSVSITPTSSTSKILILQNAVIAQESYTNGSADTTLYRNNSVNLAGTSRVFSTVGGSGGTPQWANGGITYLDSPASTSATTYTVYFAGAGSSNSVYNGSGQYAPTAMLVAMEISQ